MVDVQERKVRRLVDRHGLDDVPSREPSASSTNSSNARVTGRSSNAPASMRVMSSRLVTSRARPVRLQLNQLEKLVPIGRAELGLRPGAGSRRLS